MRGDFFDEAMQYRDVDIAAQKAAEEALYIKQHSNGAEPAEICPKCQGKKCRLEVMGVMYGVCEMCNGSGKLRHC